MVGKSTSKGCRRCRSKKKGCDQSRPRCGQCQRLGATCEYETRPFFVTGQAEASAKASSCATSPSKSSSSSSSIVSSILASSLARTELEIRLDADFWTIYLPQEELNAATIFGCGASASSWVPTLRYLASQDNTVRLALNAVSFVTLGRLRQDEDYIRRGARLYSIALSQTNRMLAHREHCRSDAALASTRFLAMYESFRGDDAPGPSSQSMDWRRHVEGTCHILQLRGPAASATAIGHQLYVDVRASSVMCGIFGRRPLSLADIDWNTLPWQDRPRNIGDELVDIMSTVPSLLQRQDMTYDALLKPCDDVSGIIGTACQIIEECIATASELVSWEERMIGLCLLDNSSNPRSETSLDQEFSPKLLMSLRDVGIDHGYGVLDLASQYWFACVFLFGRTIVFHRFIQQAIANLSLWHSTVTALTSPSPSPSSRLHNTTQQHTPLPDLPPWLDPEPSASAIAQNAPLFFGDAAGLWGAQHATICLAAGTHYYSATGRQMTAEMAALRGAIFTPNGQRFSMGFLRSIAHLASPSFMNEDGRVVDSRTFEGREKLARKWFRMDDVPYVAASETV